MLSSSQFHSDFKALVISTLEVGVLGLKLKREIKAEALTRLLAEADITFSWRALNNAVVSIEIEQESAHAYLAHINTELMLESACVRCLNAIAHRIPISFSIRMLEDEEKHKLDQKPDEMTIESDSLMDEEDVLVGYFSGKSIDLGLILREQIFLEVPDYPRCGGDMAINKKSCELLLKEHEATEVPANPFVKLLKKN